MKEGSGLRSGRGGPSRQGLRGCGLVGVALLVPLGCTALPQARSGAPCALHVSVDLDLGEFAAVELSNGQKVQVGLRELSDIADPVNGAVRQSQVKVDVDGQEATLPSGLYTLPLALGSVQIDCPITRGYLAKARKNVWGLRKAVRLRLWPAASPWFPPGEMVYPARQRWFSTSTHMANEPVYVDGGDQPGKKDIYYHYGLDMGGCEGLVDVVAATDGTVVSSGKEVLPGYEKGTPVDPRYDVIYLLDPRGWYYRYSHLKFFEPEIRAGAVLRKGQKLGVLGKEGGSGGWSHLHFDITQRQPSGDWGIEEGYAFLWESYLRERSPKLMAVARPHHLLWTGQTAVLDGSRSFGSGLRFQWIFEDGTNLEGSRVERRYDRPGSFAEILKITDPEGRVDYDFAVVQVIDRERPNLLPPTIHANYAPTFGIRPGDPVTFKVRTFRTQDGHETWDFGDGTPPVEVRSDGNAVMHAATGYAEIIHRYEKPGHYLARVERENSAGMKAVTRLQVRVGSE